MSERSGVGEERKKSERGRERGGSVGMMKVSHKKEVKMSIKCKGK